MDQNICLLPMIPIRREPSHRSEQLSQLIFGETMSIQEVNSEWVRIFTNFDRYTGWVEKTAISPYNEDPQEKIIIADPVAQVKRDNTPVFLPAGSEIPRPDAEGRFNIAGISFQLSDVLQEASGSPYELAMKFLHSPYLWGGRTFLGIDCSGLVQVVFKILGIALVRDACDQVNEGTEVAFSDIRENDLAFFKENDRVTHVGIYKGNGQIIHASKMVRIDMLDEKGIFNEELGRYSHKLDSVRRVGG